MFGLIASIALAFAALLGWSYAHDTIASECEKLGAFYVADTVYECKAKPSIKENT